MTSTTLNDSGRPARSTAGRAVGPLLAVDDVTVVHRRGGVLSRRGRETTAVRNVSLRVERGEIVGLVGESGSGKTSLALAVALLNPIAHGTIHFDGVDLRTADRRTVRALRPDIQVVMQDPHAALDPRQRVRAGLKELRGLRRERTAWIDDAGLMERVGLTPDTLDRFPHEISGGQAQRVCIARALLLRPSLLIADEITSSLDVSVQAQILSLLFTLRDEEGLSVLFISHDLAVIEFISDQIYVLRGGDLVEHGPTAEITRNPQHEYTRRLLDAVPRLEV